MNICLKHAIAWDLDIDLQAIEKVQALLGKQLYKTKNLPAMD
ncbi:hypothetical protein [Bartonella sp. B1099]|nr:hypothetical protein [Bartonella sp. B1099]